MAFTPKTWLQRVVENPGRRLLTATGTTNVWDITRNEGVVVQDGDAFSVANMNDLETRIASAVAELTPITKTITWTSGYTPSSNMIYKSGNIVTIQLKFGITSIGNGFQIGTVPSDCIPATSTGFGGIGLYIRPSSIYAACYLQVLNTGAITIANEYSEAMTYAGAFLQYKV